MALTKSDFLTYLSCPKSLWLQTYKPDVVPAASVSAFGQRLAAEGVALEQDVQKLVRGWPDAETYSFQHEFTSEDGLHARADMVQYHDDGTIDIYEIKASTTIKPKAPDYHLKDATFQRIVAVRAGYKVGKSFLVHLNGEYVRSGEIDLDQLFAFSDETVRVRGLFSETEAEIDGALALLENDAINEDGCSCLTKTPGHHCASFDYFNPGVPAPSIYTLPRVSASKLERFVSEGRLSLGKIGIQEVSSLQKPVLQSHLDGAPCVDLADIESFLSGLKFPLYFLDYESISTAVPMVDGVRPYQHLPFQVSIHVLTDDGTLTHAEYLAEEVALPRGLVEAMKQVIGPTGSVLVWNKTFECTRNTDMAAWFPDQANFLIDLNSRIMDLMEVYKTGYVDIRFGGSTSIKKVLPVVVPELSYDALTVADGTAAMDAWSAMLSTSGLERGRLRLALLEYCKLDTLAMVRLYQFAEGLL